jgi:hypothetical protein
MRPGQVERRTHDYKRNGVTDLFAALNLATGQVVHQTRTQHRAVEFRQFLVKRPGFCRDWSVLAFVESRSWTLMLLS